ncbi:MAG: hypothetical protein KA802_17690 [Saprospiraceae bacterium]|nr:hypothetical protein [Saprospiraceae bacterium]
MGLIGNHFRLNTGVQQVKGDVQSRTAGNFARYSNMCYTRSQNGATTVISGAAIPAGGYPSATYYPPQEAGEMSFRVYSQGGLTATLAPTLPMSIDLTGTGDLDATAGLVISMLCAMTGTGDLTADIQGLIDMSCDMTGMGDLAATISAYGNMAIDLVGEGDLEATIAAYGNMAIDITVTGTGLTTANVGHYVWAALAAENNTSGTMGELLNNAAAGGNPWDVLIEGGYTASDVMKILVAVAAGKSIITDNGDGSMTIVFRDLDDSLNRVQTDVENSQRDDATFDLS